MVSVRRGLPHVRLLQMRLVLPPRASDGPHHADAVLLPKMGASQEAGRTRSAVPMRLRLTRSRSSWDRGTESSTASSLTSCAPCDYDLDPAGLR